jgi:hypothetical protein
LRARPFHSGLIGIYDQAARAVLPRVEKPLGIGLGLRPPDGFKRRDLAHHVGRGKADGLCPRRGQAALIALSRSEALEVREARWHNFVFLVVD